MEKKYSMSELGPVIEEVIRFGGKIRLTVTGMSMYPLLRNRLDSVLLKKVSEIKKYDILLYTREDGSYVLHRAVNLKEGFVDIIGDGESRIEENVPREKIIAVVDEIKRGKRIIKINSFLYKMYCRIWTAIIPFRVRLLNTYIKIRRKF